MDRDDDGSGGLTAADRRRLAAIRSAGSLSELAATMGADSEHDAYLDASRDWYDLRGRELSGSVRGGGVPGATVTVDGHAFHVHGITHADTPAERAFLRDHVGDWTDRGATVYCEQGIRNMYFADMPAVCVMDDYRWAMARCRDLDVVSHVADLEGEAFAGVAEDVDAVVSRFREAAFSLIDRGGEVYGDRFRRALGAVASGFLVSHEGMATGSDFESFRLTALAAEDPDYLPALQNYYERALLPQPLEREWLRRHDPELEVVTHARNERMADYALYHNDDAAEVHLVVGAAHQPGIRYYLERVRDGERGVDFEPVG
jgi:hypothetical protein